MRLISEFGSGRRGELVTVSHRKINKPVMAYIGGKVAREDTHAEKVKALREAGATVVDEFGELPDAV